jgi:hypothetical protein
MKTPATLTDQEIEILRRGREDPNIITDYFLRPKGGTKGFRFDENFDPVGAWQIPFFFSTQRDRYVSGGVGTGKTIAAAMAYGVVYPLLIHPNYKFMNVAPVSYQAVQMYQIIIDLARDTPFERLIWKMPERPNPEIELRFKVYNSLVVSTMQFMSIDKNAKNIFSFEGDVINIDEAAQIDRLEEVIISVGTRLRGAFRGRNRLGILSMTTNPWDNNYFWYLFDMAQADPDAVLSMVVSSRHNHNITKEQLERILARIPESERDRFIDGARPEGRGDYFNKISITDCEDEGWGQWIEQMVKDQVPGFAVNRSTGVGVDYYMVPPVQGSHYMILGDPGTGQAPNRNAPVIMVFRVDDFPTEKAEIVAAYWGNGEGSIAPFTRRLAKWMEVYKPLFVGVDSTATQKNTAETINALMFDKDEFKSPLEGRYEDLKGFPIVKEDKLVNIFGEYFNLKGCPKISGLDFSGGRKPAYLVSANFMLEARLFRWPKFFTGMRSQLSNYDPAKDRAGVPKIPQDIVCCFSMGSFVIRKWFYVNLKDEEDEDQDSKGHDLRPGRTARLSFSSRSQRSSSR